MKVVLTDNALADLLAIGRSIAIDNPRRAESFIAEIEDRCRRLGSLPFAFPLLPEREETGIRRRPYGDYLIFYRVLAEVVEILHVVHGARNYDAILFPED